MAQGNRPDEEPSRENEAAGQCGKGAMGRTSFLRLMGAGTAALGAPRLPVMAGPFEADEYKGAVPLDKKLSPEWVASLTRRGETQVYRDPEARCYVGHCPHCTRRVSLRVGPQGITARFFRATPAG